MPRPNAKTPCTPDAVAALCAGIGFAFTPEQHGKLAAYLNLLEKWNRVMNLVGRASWQDILTHLVADSFHLADLISALPLPEAPECWDLGSGAGLPGLPLRILWQKGNYHLVEAREKRALFLRTVLAGCPLPGVSVFQGRAEAFMPTRPSANFIVSRAFMPWGKVLALVNGHVAPGAICVFLTLGLLPEPMPKGWSSLGGKSYTAGCDSRYLAAVQFSGIDDH